MMSISSVMAPSPAVSAVPTASSWIALLQEEDLALQTAAVQKLLETVDTVWHQIAESLPDLEAVSENAQLPTPLRQMAAAVASRVFFHLEEPAQALRLALDAGPQHFDPTDHQSPYVQRLVAAALDAYIAHRRPESAVTGTAATGSATQQPLSAESSLLSVEQLQTMVYRLIESSCQAQQYEHALGIALEAQETDQVRAVLHHAGPTPALLQYAQTLAIRTVTSKQFRMQALQVMADCLLQQFPTRKDAAYELVVLYQQLQQTTQTAAVLKELFLSPNQDERLLGLQLCFDLQDSGDQAFVLAVAQQLPAEEPAFAQAQKVLTGGFPSELALSFLHKHSHADKFIMEQLKKSLEERSSGSRSSLLHHAAVLTHSYLYAGTTNDSFLRTYLDWMKKASNWAKFSATASLGIVHAGHITEAMHLLQPYLPADPTERNNDVAPTGGYAEGGSLYALGIIHGSHAGSSAQQRAETNEFLRKHLRASHANEAISHGAALGVGLTAMGTANLEIVRELKELLDTDSAVAGEAAGIAIGLVLVGTGAGNTHHSLTQNAEELADIVMEMKSYARETQHEKIIRGIAMALALMSYGQEEHADALIEEMRSDRDPVMRYGAQYATALAYCGTGSNKAIRVLLHTAVSDVSDDVRMAAVIALAFLLYRTPERVPQLVQLLLESFNPHVRYASCMAVGIAMAGTGDAESITMLEPMLDDMTDYVRQGALMGTALIYMQQSDTCNNRRIRAFREKLMTIVSEKHQSTLTKMGAILSTGILDAGGRNCALQLGSRLGFTKMTSAVGLCLWLQHWHWYPMLHMFSLALTPTYTIGLNAEFKYPKKFEIVCEAKPSQFAYPKKLEEKKEEKKKRVETVTLSTTAKEKARLARKRAKLGLDDTTSMDVDQHANTASSKDNKDKDNNTEAGTAGEDAAPQAGSKEDDDAMEVDTAAGVAGGEPTKTKKKREPEPTSFRIPNPARITTAQAAYCHFDLQQRYRPIRVGQETHSMMGVIILTDSAPPNAEPDDTLETIKSPSDEPMGETSPPEPFVWTPPPPPARSPTTTDPEPASE